MKRVDLAGLAIDATTGAPLVVLREHDSPNRLLPIFIGALEAASIASAVSGEAPPRPLTHDLMASMLQTLHAQVDAVEVTELRDGAFFARLTVRADDIEHQLDSRPSDAIALALRLGVPLLASDEVLDEAGALPDQELDDEAIDEAVDEFRTFLSEVDPSEFAEALGELPAGELDDTDSAAGRAEDRHDHGELAVGSTEHENQSPAGDLADTSGSAELHETAETVDARADDESTDQDGEVDEGEGA